VSAALLGLAACAPTAPPGEPVTGVAHVAFGSRGSIHGGAQTRVLADDRIVRSGHPGGGRPPVATMIQGPPGAHAAVRAVLAAQGPGVAQALRGQTGVCMDYGTDFVTADPLVPGVPDLTATCPVPAMQGLLGALRTASVAAR